MTLSLPTDTRVIKLDARQYRLFNVDLGEGIARSTLVIGMIVLTVWAALLWMLPVSLSLGNLVFLAGPPLVVVVLLVNKDEGGRPTWASVLDRLRFRCSWRRRRNLLARPGGDSLGRPLIVAPEWIVLADNAARVTGMGQNEAIQAV